MASDLFYYPKRSHRIRQLWTILVAHADRGDTLSCAAVYEMLDCRPALAQFYLNVIELYCVEKRLPPLVLLVGDAPLLRPHGVNVNMDELVEPNELLERVFRFPWFSVRRPSRVDVLDFKPDVREFKARPPGNDDDEQPEPSSGRWPTVRAMHEEMSEYCADIDEALFGYRSPPAPKTSPRRRRKAKHGGLRLVSSPEKPKPKHTRPESKD